MSWSRLPDDEPDPPRLARESLDSLVRGMGAPAADLLSLVFSRWEDLVGRQEAGHCEPLSVHHGVLTIGVRDPAWATQIRYLGADVCSRANALVGWEAITGVEVRVRA